MLIVKSVIIFAIAFDIACLLFIALHSVKWYNRRRLERAEIRKAVQRMA